MKTAFRVDASAAIGSGHFMRCLTLADALHAAGTHTRFVCRELPEHLRRTLDEHGHELLTLPSITHPAPCDDNALDHAHWLGASQQQDATETLAALTDAPGDTTYDWLVVDHYGIDHRWETMLRKIARKILVIDDLADRRHDCDALVDQNLYAHSETRYAGKTPAACKLFLGPSYAFLRDEFHAQRAQLQPRTGKVRNILIYFGGVDANNHTLEAINALLATGTQGLCIDVVIGAQHPAREAIQTACHANGFRCHVQTRNMAELMARADLAIGAGGISSFERLYLRLPSILTPIADNQVEQLEHMRDQGLCQLYTSHTELEMQLRQALSGPLEPPPDCVSDGNKALVAHLLS